MLRRSGQGPLLGPLPLARALLLLLVILLSVPPPARYPVSTSPQPDLRSYPPALPARLAQETVPLDINISFPIDAAKLKIEPSEQHGCAYQHFGPREAMQDTFFPNQYRSERPKRKWQIESIGLGLLHPDAHPGTTAKWNEVFCQMSLLFGRT